MTGVTTEVCVQSTAREANDRGFEVLVVSDATGHASPPSRRLLSTMIVSQGGIVGWTAETRRGEGAGVWSRRWRRRMPPPPREEGKYIQGVGVAGHRGAGCSRGRRRFDDGEAPGHRRQRRGPPRRRRGGFDAATPIKNLLRGARASARGFMRR